MPRRTRSPITRHARAIQPIPLRRQGAWSFHPFAWLLPVSLIMCSAIAVPAEDCLRKYSAGERQLLEILFGAREKRGDGTVEIVPHFGAVVGLDARTEFGKYAFRWKDLAEIAIRLQKEDAGFRETLARASGNAVARINAEDPFMSIVRGMAIVEEEFCSAGIYDAIEAQSSKLGFSPWPGGVPEKARMSEDLAKSIPFVQGDQTDCNLENVACARTFHFCSGALRYSNLGDGCFDAHRKALESPAYDTAFSEVSRPFAAEADKVSAMLKAKDPGFRKAACDLTRRYQEALRDAGILTKLAAARESAKPTAAKP